MADMVDARILDALGKTREGEDADVDFLFHQLGITPTPMQRETAKCFRVQTWHVAAHAGFDAAQQPPRLVELEPER